MLFFADSLKDLLIARKAAGFLFGKDFFAVNGNLENPAPGWNQLGFESKFIFYGLCQTGSLGIVVSYCAILNLDVHFPPVPK